jgi:hypothetical protein
MGRVVRRAMSTRPLAHALGRPSHRGTDERPIQRSELARELERERIGRLSEALEHERFIGVTGEAGKTHMLTAVAHEQAGGLLTATRRLRTQRG